MQLGEWSVVLFIYRWLRSETVTEFGTMHLTWSAFEDTRILLTLAFTYRCKTASNWWSKSRECPTVVEHFRYLPIHEKVGNANQYGQQSRESCSGRRSQHQFEAVLSSVSAALIRLITAMRTDLS